MYHTTASNNQQVTTKECVLICGRTYTANGVHWWATDPPDTDDGYTQSPQDYVYPCVDPPSPEECDEGEVWDETLGRCVPEYCPIMVATGRDAKYKMTSAAAGVRFDIDGDSDVDQVSWTDPDSDVAFLALDRNGDGAITSGRELLGNFTVVGVTNGFDALLLSGYVVLRTRPGLNDAMPTLDDVERRRWIYDVFLLTR